MPKDRDDAREAESRATLQRAARDSETLGTSSLARAGRRLGDHFAGQDAEREGLGSDPAEVWGRRVGRVLSVFLGIGLVWMLGWQLGWW